MSSVPTWQPHFPRVYNTVSGKQKKCYKGSQGDEGSLLKVSARSGLAGQGGLSRSEGKVLYCSRIEWALVQVTVGRGWKKQRLSLLSWLVLPQDTAQVGTCQTLALGRCSEFGVPAQFPAVPQADCVALCRCSVWFCHLSNANKNSVHPRAVLRRVNFAGTQS